MNTMATAPLRLASIDGRRLDTIAFDLPDELVATAPIEATGLPRERTRMLVSYRFDGELLDAEAADLPDFLDPGDVLVVNTSGTLPAAIPTGDGRVLHLSTEQPGGLSTVEVRQACGEGSQPLLDAETGDVVVLPDGGSAQLLAPYPVWVEGPVRLWTARLTLPGGLLEYLGRHGHPIRYGCGDEAWPLSAYQTVFATEPGSAEMPSASRAFTPELVVRLTNAGIGFAPVLLHAGVSSLEDHEPPYAERFRVPAASAERVNNARTHGHRVISVGTTATRAIETTADENGFSHPGEGWTELLISPDRGVRVVDGILSGWHEPAASHLALMEAIAGRPLLETSYAAAIKRRYRWHEFGDLHLILP